MKQLKRTIVGQDKVAMAIGLANGIGVLLLVGIGYAYELSLTGWILGWLLISGLANILLAWNNERRLAARRDRICNEIVGTSVVARERFRADAGEYKGAVQFGSEHWRAVSAVPLAAGQRATVAGRRGLILEVAPEPHAPPAGSHRRGPETANRTRSRGDDGAKA